jgi:hypothetical protein
MLAGEAIQALVRGDDSIEAELGGLLVAEHFALIRSFLTLKK